MAEVALGIAPSPFSATASDHPPPTAPDDDNHSSSPATINHVDKLQSNAARPSQSHSQTHPHPFPFPIPRFPHHPAGGMISPLPRLPCITKS